MSARGDNRILYDARWDGPHGIGRFCRELLRRVPGLSPLRTSLRLFHPFDPLWTSALTLSSSVRAYFTPGFNAPLFSRVPLVLTVHDLNYIHFPENSDPLRRLYFQTIVRPACRSAYRVLTVSEFSREQIVEWAGVEVDRVVNVGAGVDESFNPESRPANLGFPYLLAMSNARAHKNTARLIDAFHRSGLASSVKLTLVGKLDQESTDRIGRLGVAEAVHVIDYVADEDLPSLYRGSLALCMPSLFEGFGLPILEAMACGVPVMASTVTSIPEVAGDAALLTEPTDIDAMADAIRRIVTDTDLRSTLIARGLDRVRKFSWAHTALRVSTLLEGLR